MTDRIRIVSNEGTGHGTRVFLPDGTELPYVTKIEIGALTPDSVNEATITFGMVEIDIQFDPEKLGLAVGTRVSWATELGSGKAKKIPE